MIDFLEPRPWEKLCREAFRLTRESRRSTRLIATVVALFLGAVGAESLRVSAAWHQMSRWDAERQALSDRLIGVEKKVQRRELERTILTSLIQLRAEVGDQAVRIAIVGNAMGPRVGLLTLRRTSGTVEIEGRARSVADVAAAIRRLPRFGAASRTTFALRRDGAPSRYVWFRLGLQQ
jgi:Tfp pilus assembly protein PilN